MNVSEHPWGPVDPNSWDTVPVTRGRLATEADVRNGCAVFYLEGAEPHDAEPLSLPIPRLAVLRDTDTGTDLIVVAIQAERSFQKRLVGYRRLHGGNGMCMLEELEWIDATDFRFREAAHLWSRGPAV